MTIVTITRGAGYTTRARVRTVGGFTATDAPDALLDDYIGVCSRILSRDISIREWNARVDGAIDATNRVYALPHPYIADRDLDGVVGTSDVVVRTVTKSKTDNSIARVAATVSSLDSVSGTVTLSAAPATTVDWVEADYERYRAPVYRDALDDATAALVCHILTMKNREPGKVTLAALKGASTGTDVANGHGIFSPGSRWLVTYRDLVRRIVAGEIIGLDPVASING